MNNILSFAKVRQRIIQWTLSHFSINTPKASCFFFCSQIGRNITNGNSFSIVLHDLMIKYMFAKILNVAQRKIET